jgi:hypothetical protein
MSFNDIESLLRERLGAGSSRPVPSHGFEERVHRSLTPRGAGNGRRLHALEALVGLAAVVALVAVALPWLTGPRPGTGPGGGSGGPAVAAKPTPTPTPLAHARAWGLTFDYPATWTLANSQPSLDSLDGLPPTGNLAALGFLGTGTATQNCPVWKQGGPVAICTSTWTLPEGSIVIRFAPPALFAGTDPTYTWSGYQALSGPDIPGATKLTIDGMPVRFAKSTSDLVPYGSETIPGATEVLWWGLPVQQQNWLGYSIVAVIKGPNASELEAQAKALIESIHYVKEPSMLPTDSTLLAAARQSALLKYFATMTQFADDEHNHAYDCFPRTEGASNQATIIQTLNQAPMTKPLAVTCTTVSIEPNAMQGWTVQLTQTWDAGPGYSAGECDVTSYTTTDGSTTSTSFGSSSKSGPMTGYPNVGPSKYKG